MIRVDSLVSVGRKGAVVMLAPLYDGVSVTPSVKEGAEWIHLRASSYATLSQVAVEVDENTGESPRKGVVYFASDRGDIDSTVIWQAGKDEISIDGDVTVDSYFNEDTYRPTLGRREDNVGRLLHQLERSSPRSRRQVDDGRDGRSGRQQHIFGY